MSNFINTNLLTKPTSNNEMRKINDTISSSDDEILEGKVDGTMNLIDFSQLYQIHGIPIFEVLIIYASLYYFIYVYLEKSIEFTFLVLLTATVIIVMKNNIT